MNGFIDVPIGHGDMAADIADQRRLHRLKLLDGLSELGIRNLLRFVAASLAYLAAFQHDAHGTAIAHQHAFNRLAGANLAARRLEARRDIAGLGRPAAPAILRDRTPAGRRE